MKENEKKSYVIRSLMPERRKFYTPRYLLSLEISERMTKIEIKRKLEAGLKHIMFLAELDRARLQVQLYKYQWRGELDKLGRPFEYFISNRDFHQTLERLVRAVSINWTLRPDKMLAVTVEVSELHNLDSFLESLELEQATSNSGE